MLLCNHTGRTCTTFLHVQISRDSLRLEDVNIWSHIQGNYSEHPRGRTAYDSSSPAHIDEQITLVTFVSYPLVPLTIVCIDIFQVGIELSQKTNQNVG